MGCLAIPEPQTGFSLEHQGSSAQSNTLSSHSQLPEEDKAYLHTAKELIDQAPHAKNS